VLGVLAATVGAINLVPVHTLVPAVPEFLHDWLYYGPEGLNGEHYHELITTAEFGGMSAGTLPGLGETATLFASAGISLTVALAGSALAIALYRGDSPVEHTDRLGSIKTLLFNNYYQDEYQVWLAQGLTARVARGADKFDQGVVDGVVNGISSVSLFGGSRVRRIQTGIVSNYATLLTLGLVALLVGIGLMGGWF